MWKAALLVFVIVMCLTLFSLSEESPALVDHWRRERGIDIKLPPITIGLK
uniref:Venom peptide n=1 Tax=Haemonchus contortus TaxID=6289 RepID=A0A7I5EBH4_HAECO